MFTWPSTPLAATRQPRINLRAASAWLPALSILAAASLLTAPPVGAQVPQQLSQQAASIDPPGRVARMNLAEGPVSYAPADSGADPRWTAASLNRPLTTGDRLWTGQRARSELHIGSTAVRLGEQTSLDFLELDDDTTQLRLAQGTMKLRVRNLFEGQRIEINTPNLAFVITQPGDYRIDANPASNLGAGTTRVVVQQGAGTLYGDGGASVNIASGQQANFTDTQLTPANPGHEVQDGFDAWAHQRDRLEDQSVSARYVPREVIGYQQLDTYGDWQQDPTYGAVWLPRAVPVNWAPYRAGHWSWIAPWGWTWVDDAPWGFAPFHYGRWAQIGPRWCWVPGRIAARPVYAPALVAFIGGNAGGVNWNVSIGQQRPRPGLGWFPLAPGEAFRPTYQHSPRYVTNVNQNIVVNNINVTNNYRYQRQGHAVSVMSAEDFARGQRVRPEGQRLNPADLGRAQVIAPERGGLPQRVANLRDMPRVASPAALPPAAVAVRPVVTSQIQQPGQRDERRNDRRDERGDQRQNDARQNDPRQNDPQGNARAGRPGDNLGQLPRPGQPVQPGQPAISQQGAAPDRGAFDAEQRARAEQRRQQQERLQGQPGQPTMQGQQGQQGLLGQPREQERQQRDLARQQQERAGGQRPPGEESLGQRALREQAQRNANVNGNPNLVTPPVQPGRPDAAPGSIEQAQREQQRLQRDQQRQQTDAARQQDQQRRQADESLGQRAQQEQSQRQQQAQQAQQTQQRAQQDQARQQQAAQQQQQIQQRTQQDQQRQAQQQQQQQRQQQDQARQQQAAEQQAQQAQQRTQQDQQRQAREQQQQQQQQRQQQDQARQATQQQAAQQQQAQRQQAQEQQAQQAQQRAQQDQARQQQLAQQQQQSQQRAQQEQQRQAREQQQLMQQQQQQRPQPEQPRGAGRERQPRPGEAVSGAPADERFNRRRE